MKKVKIMLSAIAIFAVVGGALAFKAKTYGATIYTTTNESVPNPKCPLEKIEFTITNVKPSPTAVQISVTTITVVGQPAGQPCVLSYTKPQV